MIVALVAVGCSPTEAARYVGVAPQTIINTGRRDPVFADRVDRAAAAFEAAHLRNLQTATGRSWRASAWVLERLAPKRFADPLGKDRRRIHAAVRRAIAEEVGDDGLRTRLLRRVARAFAG